METQRLRLVKLNIDMAYDIHINSLDDDVRKYVPDEVFETEDDAKKAIEYLMTCYGNYDLPQLYALITKDEGKNIGYVQFIMMDEDQEAYEVGYHIAKQYTNSGYATEALTYFVKEMHNHVKEASIWGNALKENIASIRVLEKSGFEIVYEGKGLYQGRKRNIVQAKWKGYDND